jgi:GDSL-like Lipase/Acylhydrolase family
MKSLLRRLGQGSAIIAITLALDFALTNTLLSGMNAKVSKAESENWDSYLETKPYEHGLVPNKNTERAWGLMVYSWKTDQYGFRTGECAPRQADPARPSVFVIGDSFVEGMGTPFEKSFAGLIACDAAREGKAAWNLGVASYSPIIYHLKIRAAAKQLGTTPKSIYLFLDLSDIDDDANVYRLAADGSVEKKPAHYTPYVKGTPFNLGRFVLNNFSIARLVYDMWVASSFSYRQSLGRERARWAFDPELMEKWGRRGLATAAANLDKVVELCRKWDCRLTLIVYPWPDNVMAGDRNSVQVTFWRDWAKERGVRFVDAFGPFFREAPEATLHEYYFAGDVHFNDAGNRLMFDTVRQAIGADW